MSAHADASIPSFLRRKGKKKGNVVQVWRGMIPQSGPNNVMFVRVRNKNKRQNPWTGEGSKKAFEFLEPRTQASRWYQAPHLALEAGKDYFFDGEQVPKDHAFYFTRSIEGGAGSGRANDPLILASEPQEVNGETKPTLLKFSVPTVSNTAWYFGYYQCSRPGHKNMGAPFSVYMPGQVPKLEMTNPDGTPVAMVLQDKAGNFIASYADDKVEDKVLGSLSALLSEFGLRTEAKFRLDDNVSTAPTRHIVCAALLSEDDDGIGRDSEDEALAPAVLMHADGSHRCNHVHMMSDLMQWLSQGQAKSEKSLCPTCASNLRIVPIRGKRAKSQTQRWYDAEPTGNIVLLNVEAENPEQHPWAGEGHKTKYTVDGRQGVRIVLETGTEYTFQGVNIPSKYHLHLVRDKVGGKKAKDTIAGPITDGDSFHFTPTVDLFSKPVIYYQDTREKQMGGPLRVMLPDTRAIFTDEESGYLVCGNTKNGKIVVDQHEFDDLDDALEHLDISLTLGQNNMVFLGDIDDDDDHAAVMALDPFGTVHCNHIHTKSELLAWQAHPDSTSGPCPTCASAK